MRKAPGPTEMPYRLAPEMRARAIETLTLAFEEDAILCALLGDPDRRRKLARWLFKGVVRYCEAWGEVHILRQGEAVACWLPPGNTYPTEWRMLRAWDLLPGPYWIAGWQAIQAYFAVQEASDARHKHLMPGPHWYLWALGVRPQFQGQGLGGRLLGPQLARADRAGLPCYLETQTPDNVAFYERRGFRVAEMTEVRGIKLWFMVRDPLRSKG